MSKSKRGTKGNDVLVGGPGKDHLHGGRGDDALYGNGGDDRLHGGKGNDFLDGGDGRDRLRGGRDDDALIGGAGDDALRGGKGNDRLSGGEGNDRIDGGSGFDTAVFSGNYLDYQITLGRHHSRRDDPDPVTVSDLRGAAPDGTDRLRNVEALEFADRTIYLDGRNNAPVAVDDAAATLEDQAIIIPVAALLGNDADFEGDRLTLAGVGGARNGSVALDGRGNVVFTPAADFSGEASFSYTVSDGRGGSDEGLVRVTVDPVAAPDRDRDGIPDAEEANGPNRGDANRDGIPDGQQANVASLQNAVTGDYVTLVSSAGTRLEDVAAIGTLPPGAPADVEFPFGLFSFELHDVAPGGAAQVTVLLPAGANTDAYLKFGPEAGDTSPHWYDFVFDSASGTGAQFSGDAVTLNFVDGQRGDSDLIRNGVIVDPGAPVRRINTPPAAGDDSATTNEDTAVTINVLANDSDAQTSVLTIVNASDPARGSTVVNANGTITYTPDANYFGADSFTYRVRDGSGATDVATVNVNVLPVNDAPVAVADNFTTAEDTELVIPYAALVANDTDVDGDALTLGLSFNVGRSHGDFDSIDTDGDGVLDAVRFVPIADFSGPGGVVYHAKDANGASSALAVPLEILVTSVNDAPELSAPATVSTDEDTAVAIGGVSVSDVDAASVGVAFTALHGTFRVGDTAGLVVFSGLGTSDILLVGTQAEVNEALAGLEYVPSANFHGTDTVELTTTDLGSSGAGGVLTDSAAIALTVNSVNDRPVAVADYFTTAEDTELVIPYAALVANDTDVDGDALTLGLSFNVGRSHGDFDSIDTDGDGVLDAVRFVPIADFSGPGGVVYHAKDANGASSALAVPLEILVTPVNDAPVLAAPATQSTDEDTAVAIGGVSVSDVDAGTGLMGVLLQASSGVLTLGDTVGLGRVIGLGTGSVELEGSQTQINEALAGLAYRPNANFHGAGTITLAARDGGQSGAGGEKFDTATIALTVNSVNDAPVAVADNFTTAEDTELVIPYAALVANDTDVDGDALTLGLSFNVGRSHGDFDSIDTDGDGVLDAVRFVPIADFSGPGGVVYHAKDANGASSALAVPLEILVTPVNDAPVLAAPATQSTDEDTAVAIGGVSVSDVDAGTGLMGVLLQASSGVLTLGDTVGLGRVIGLGTGSVELEGSQTQINEALAGLAYRPNANFHGAGTITLAARDGGQSGAGGEKFDTATIALTVNSVNDAPVAVADNFTTAEDTELVIPYAALVANDTDVDGDALTLGLSFNVGRSHGDFDSIDTDGDGVLDAVRFVPIADFSGPGGVVYHAKDANGASSALAVPLEILVTSVNDAPELSAPATVSTDEDTAVAIGGVSVSDVDAASVGVAFTALHGTFRVGDTAGLVVFSGLGTSDILLVGTQAEVNEALAGLEYVPSANFHGTDTVELTTTDLGSSGAGGVLTDSAAIALTVNSVNDRPVAVADYFTTAEDTELVIPYAALVANDTDVDGDALTLGLSFNVGRSHGDFDSIDTDGDGVLDAVRFVPIADFSGPGGVVYHAKDANGASSALAVPLEILVTPVNDAPVLAAPATQSTDEDTAVAIGGVSVSDVDAGTGLMGVLLQASSGVLTLGDTVGLGRVIGLGTGSVELEGSQTQINEALAGLAYRPNANFHGAGTITLAARDGGQSGAGGEKFDTATIALTVNSVNDAPVAVADNFTTAEDTELVIPYAALVANDTDVDGDALTLGLSFNVGRSHGDFDSIDTDGDGVLDAVRFVPIADFSGPGGVVYHAKDANGASSALAVPLEILVTSVNDAPELSAPATVSTDEDTAVAIGGVSVSDVDAASVGVAFTALHGTFRVGDTAGLVVFSGLGTSDILLVGTQAEVNEALAGLEYVPSANFHGTDTVELTTTDLGSSGAGGVLTDSAAIALTVNPVDDESLVAADDAFLLAEDVSLAITPDGLTANDEGVDLSITSVDNPLNGYAEIYDGLVYFYPEWGFSGTASFDYTVTDGTGAADTATVTLDYAPVADAPAMYVSDAAGGVGSDIVLSLGAYADDPDGSETIAISLLGVPAGASFSRQVDNGEGYEIFPAGIDLGGGVWSFAQEELDGLTISGVAEGTYTLTLSATATETATGESATQTASFVLDSAPPSIDVADGVVAFGPNAAVGADGADGSRGFSSSGSHLIDVDGPVILPGVLGGDAADGAAGASAAGQVSNALFAPGVVSGAEGYDTLSIFATAAGGAGGGGGRGGQGGTGDFGDRSIFTGPNFGNSTLVEKLYFHNTAGDSGDGGAGGLGQSTEARIENATLEGLGRADVLSARASANGGRGGNGGSGEEGTYAGKDGGGTQITNGTPHAITFIGGQAGSGGDGAAGGAGNTGSAANSGVEVLGGAGSDQIELIASATGGAGGWGGWGGEGGVGAQLGAAGSGAAGGAGAGGASLVEAATVDAGDGGASISLVAAAFGGQGGRGGNGGDAGYDYFESVLLVSTPGMYEQTIDQQRIFGDAGRGAAGGAGGDAYALLTGSSVQGGMGADAVRLDVSAWGGLGGMGGEGGQAGTTGTTSETYVGTASVTTITYFDTAGIAGLYGADGVEGSAFAAITSNQVQLAGGDDFLALAAILGGAGTVLLVEGNSFSGGDGHDVLDLSGLGAAVVANGATGLLQVGAELNAIAGFEELRGTAFDDSLAGSAADDTLYGGAGDDRFVFGAGQAGEVDRVEDFDVAGGDRIDLAGAGVSGFGDFLLEQTDYYTALHLVGGAQILLNGVAAASLTVDEFVFV